LQLQAIKGKLVNIKKISTNFIVKITTSASQIIGNKILIKGLLNPDPSIDPIKYSAEKVATTIKVANKNNNTTIGN
jgi:hypothetical protein